MADRNIGPQLPPHLAHLMKQSGSQSDSDDDGDVGPAPPQTAAAAPPADAPAEPVADDYGPSLPPELMKERQTRTVGPQMPSALVDTLRRAADADEKGPELKRRRADEDDSSDDDTVGPRPPSASDAAATEEETNDAAARIIENAEKMRRKLAGEDAAPLTRGEWMTQLPEHNFLTGAALDPMRSRQFKRHDRQVQQDSSWTDTPADRERRRMERMNEISVSKKSAAKAQEESDAPSEKDLETARFVAGHNAAHRGKSLMEVYKEDHMQERADAARADMNRPFDRDRDLTARSMTAEKRAEYLKQASELNTRFSAGKKTFL